MEFQRGSRRLGEYELLAELGRGGMGVVYEARRPGDPRRLAIKVMLTTGADPEELLRFEREAQLLAQVRHPSVVAVHAYARTSEGPPYLVTDLIEGEDLARVVARSLPGAARAAAIVAQLADALEHVHALGVLHRDLKPSNVILRPDGTPVLLDFGLARAQGGQALTQTGSVLGSPGYMSPEQADARSFSELTAATDVWGLGATMFFLLTGRAPFSRSSLHASLLATLEGSANWALLGSTPPALTKIVRRCLAKAPSARYASARDLAAELRGLTLELENSTNPWWLLLTTVAGLLVVGGVCAALLAHSTPVARVPTSPTAPLTSEIPVRLAAASPAALAPAATLQALHHGATQPRATCCVVLEDNLMLQACAHQGDARLLRREESTWVARPAFPCGAPVTDLAAIPPDGPSSTPRMIAVALLSGELCLARVAADGERAALTPLFRDEFLRVALGKAPAVLVERVRSNEMLLYGRRTDQLVSAGATEVGLIRVDWRQGTVKKNVPQPLDLQGFTPAQVTGTADGALLFAGGGRPGESAAFWPADVSYYRETTRPQFIAGPPRRCVSSADPPLGVWGDDNGGLTLGRWASGGPTLSITSLVAPDRLGNAPHAGPVTATHVAHRRNPDSLWLFAASAVAPDHPERWREGGELTVWDVWDEPRFVRRIPLGLAPSSLAVSSDGTTLFVIHADCSVTVWDIAALQQ